jgi:hypothetical protein
MKEGSLFCFIIMRSTKLGCLFKVSLQSFRWGEVHRLGSMMFGLVVQKFFEYWMISSLKTKLNRSWKFRRNWNVHLVLLERSWRAGSDGIYLIRFGSRMWEILIFKWVLLLKIQMNSKKPGFGRKNQLRTLEGLPFNCTIQAWFPFIFGCSKIGYTHCKTMFTCWVSLFCKRFTLGPMAQATLVSYDLHILVRMQNLIFS